jgi:hypothetical protein
MHTCIHSLLECSIIYYNHLAMDLLFLPLVSILHPRAHVLARVSEETKRTREQREEDDPREE